MRCTRWIKRNGCDSFEFIGKQFARQNRDAKPFTDHSQNSAALAGLIANVWSMLLPMVLEDRRHVTSCRSRNQTFVTQVAHRDGLARMQAVSVRHEDVQFIGCQIGTLHTFGRMIHEPDINHIGAKPLLHFLKGNFKEYYIDVGILLVKLREHPTPVSATTPLLLRSSKVTPNSRSRAERA